MIETEIKPPTAWEFACRFMSAQHRVHFVLPNYTPLNWFECDIFELTKSGYFREYEIKVSLADFRADATKGKRQWEVQEIEGRRQRVRLPDLTKHQMLERADRLGPTRFYYCCPAGLIDQSLLPQWAGLIEFERENKRICYHEVRPAPKLHQEKADPKIHTHARSVCYWRMHDLFKHRKNR